MKSSGRIAIHLGREGSDPCELQRFVDLSWGLC